MLISRRIFLVFISLSLLALSGCYMSQFSKSGKLDMHDTEYYELMPFGHGFQKALYQAHLDVNGHEFSGLLMIKAYADGSYKVAFFNELGMNFFDFELKHIQGHNHLNLYTRNIYAPLDKKILLNTFEKYFSMLLGPGPAGDTQKTYLKQDEPMVMVMMDSYKGKDGYLSTNLIEPYSGIVNVGGIFNKAKITITLSTGQAQNSPEHILIEQAGFRLRFELKLVE